MFTVKGVMHLQFSIFNSFTATMSLAKFETLKPFVSFLTLASERTFIKKHSIESRWVTGPENILFAGTSVHLSSWKLYRLGSEGVKSTYIRLCVMLNL